MLSLKSIRRRWLRFYNSFRWFEISLKSTGIVDDEQSNVLTLYVLPVDGDPISDWSLLHLVEQV